MTDVQPSPASAATVADAPELALDTSLPPIELPPCAAADVLNYAPAELRQPGGGSLARHALVLGSMTALGAFGIDAYLPTFGAIAAHYRVEEGAVQMSLVSYFWALAGGQLLYGPISDRVGRKAPLAVGFALFAVSSVAAAFAPTVGWLVVLRFFQGLGACAGMVVTRAVVRDLRSGEEAARLFALMILVLGVSPMLAPLSGALLIKWLPWQAVFWMLAALGAACLLLTLFGLEETHPAAKRSADIRQAFTTYGRLATDLPFVGTSMIGGLSQGAVFAYLAGSSFVYVTLRGVSPTVYSILFAINAAGLIGFAQLNVGLMRRYGPVRLLRNGTLLQAAAATALLVAAIVGADHVPVLAVLLFVTLGCQGALGPTSSVMALESHAAHAGAASAFMGALQFGCGAVSSALVSALFNHTSVPMAGVIAGCAVAGLAFAWLTSAGRPAASTAAAGVRPAH